MKEIVLTGVNTGDFGRKSGESFLELLKRLNAVEGIERYRISSIEPNLLTEDIIDWIASGTKFQPHFHIPLQSGSDTILKDVGRKYTTEFFAEKIDYIRSKMNPKPGETYPDGSLKPSVFFGIDVIAGLPVRLTNCSRRRTTSSKTGSDLRSYIFSLTREGPGHARQCGRTRCRTASRPNVWRCLEGCAAV